MDHVSSERLGFLRYLICHKILCSDNIIRFILHKVPSEQVIELTFDLFSSLLTFKGVVCAKNLYVDARKYGGK